MQAVKALLKAGVSLAEPKQDDSKAKGKDKKKEKDKLTSNTPDVGAAFVGYFDILGMIVTEMNRLNIPTRYEPVGVLNRMTPCNWPCPQFLEHFLKENTTNTVLDSQVDPQADSGAGLRLCSVVVHLLIS